MLTRQQLAIAVLLAVGLVATLASPLVLERWALAAEDEHVTARLEDESCLAHWGTGEGAGIQRAEVTGVSDGGVRVEVSLPYAYTTERDGEKIYADMTSEAVYEVTRTDMRRVRGDDIAPC
jgi:hypothetical protein